MVEASMVFPIVIAAVIAVIYMVICLYSSLSDQVLMQLAIREEAGIKSETVVRTGYFMEITPDDGRLGMSRILSVKEKNHYQMKGLFSKTVSRTDDCRVYVIDEAELVRQVYFARDVLQ